MAKIMRWKWGIYNYFYCSFTWPSLSPWDPYRDAFLIKIRSRSARWTIHINPMARLGWNLTTNGMELTQYTQSNNDLWHLAQDHCKEWGGRYIEGGGGRIMKWNDLNNHTSYIIQHTSYIIHHTSYNMQHSMTVSVVWPRNIPSKRTNPTHINMLGHQSIPQH
jgi:hypothetical protein